MTLDNGLKVVVVRRSGVPLVTASLLIRRGASSEGARKAGLAAMTAEMLSKGTGGYTATEIAQEIEFLGASLNTGADWDSSSVSVNVMKDKLPRAMSLMSNSAIRPLFPLKELSLLKKQTLDGFAVALSSPGTLLGYAAAVYTFDEHPSDGTPASVKVFRRADLVGFHSKNYRPENSTLIFTGDIDSNEAFSLARLFYGGWESGKHSLGDEKQDGFSSLSMRPPTVERILVIDLPKSGQAAVGFANRLGTGRLHSPKNYYSATVLNSILGGGYSARLNQEIRLKRGLSYGARSDFDWRARDVNFLATAQTKNESAAEVAELLKIEIEKLINDDVAAAEMTPRKAVVTGGFGRGLQTNNGLAARLRSLYVFGLSANELESYMPQVEAVDNARIKAFAGNFLSGNDLIIVGDASLFKADLEKRFPDHEITVIKAGRLDFSRKSLQR